MCAELSRVEQHSYNFILLLLFPMQSFACCFFSIHCDWQLIWISPELFNSFLDSIPERKQSILVSDTLAQNSNVMYVRKSVVILNLILNAQGIIWWHKNSFLTLLLNFRANISWGRWILLSPLLHPSRLSLCN